MMDMISGGYPKVILFYRVILKFDRTCLQTLPLTESLPRLFLSPSGCHAYIGFESDRTFSIFQSSPKTVCIEQIRFRLSVEMFPFESIMGPIAQTTSPSSTSSSSVRSFHGRLATIGVIDPSLRGRSWQ